MLRLHSPKLLPSGVALDAGVSDVVRGRSGQWEITRPGQVDGVPAPTCLVRCRLDKAGLWIRVPVPHIRLHLNGRPVSRLALVRPGDVLHVDGDEMLVTGRFDGSGNTRRMLDTAVLRAHGGRLHGRSFAVQERMQIGVGPDADVPLDAAISAGIAVQIQSSRAGITMRAADPRVPVRLNGERCEQATLVNGDQITIGEAQRFVLESALVPGRDQRTEPDHIDTAVAHDDDATVPEGGVRGFPWLLLASIASAAMLAALLLFGAR